MSVFVDTNVLLRSIEPSSPAHDLAVGATKALIVAGEALVITPQVAAEFWNVATRPRENNGLGLTLDEAAAELAQVEKFFTVVGETLDVYSEWKNLLKPHAVSGIPTHDARLVAAMKVYGITKILTFDASDFTRYKDIEVLHPAAIK